MQSLYLLTDELIHYIPNASACFAQRCIAQELGRGEAYRGKDDRAAATDPSHQVKRRGVARSLVGALGQVLWGSVGGSNWKKTGKKNNQKTTGKLAKITKKQLCAQAGQGEAADDVENTRKNVGFKHSRGAGRAYEHEVDNTIDRAMEFGIYLQELSAVDAECRHLVRIVLFLSPTQTRALRVSTFNARYSSCSAVRCASPRLSTTRNCDGEARRRRGHW